MTEIIETKLLPKERLNEWLFGLTDYDIFGPVQKDKYSEFSKIENPVDLNLEIRNTIIPPKGLIFPQTLTMLKYKINKTPPEVVVKNTDNALATGEMQHNIQIIIGIRPCDVSGVLTFDPTFDAEFKDPYYSKLRNDSILIGQACTEIDINCFCRSMGGSPFNFSGMDILIIDLGTQYLFQIFSQKGLELVNNATGFFNESNEESNKQYQQLRSSLENVQKRTINTTGKVEKLGEIFESEYWETISAKCLGCGICTFLCPTCYCFDITDEKWGVSGERIRSWDSCMFSEYTVHASGYNPRPARKNRLRNRFYHKFKYYPDLYDMFGCTGCGRCIRHCPVNIDIIDIINGVEKIKTEGDI